MNKFAIILCLGVIVSLSCSLVTGVFDEPAIVEATGPIHGMTVTAALDDQGWPVDASFTFPPDQPQMVVLVWIGEAAPGPVTFSWSRVTEAGDEALFEQKVEVVAGDTAFSTGLNPGILAVGTYKVVATFGGESESITWDVAEAQPGDSTAPADTTGSAASASPAPGPSGMTNVAVAEPDPAQDSGPTAVTLITRTDRAKKVEVLVSSAWGAIAPQPYTIRVIPAITGQSSGQAWEITNEAGSGVSDSNIRINPCSLPGERDVPGTGITVTVVPVGYAANGDSDTKTLGPDITKPIVELDPSVPDGQKVKPNQKIVLTVNASEQESGGSWQTGIYRMDVDGPEGPVAPSPWINSSGIPLSCTHKTWKHTEKFTYTVPRKPKAVIELCVVVQDYQQGKNDVKKCVKYPTGDTWTGTIHSETTGDYGSAGICVGEAWDLQFSVVVGEDGIVEGSGDGQLVSMPQCSGGGFDGSELATQAHHVKFDVQGTFEDDRFELQILETYIDGSTNGLYNYSLLVGSAIGEHGQLVVPLVNDKTAQGQTETSFTAEGGFVATGIHDVTMTCTDCEEEPVSQDDGDGGHVSRMIAVP